MKALKTIMTALLMIAVTSPVEVFANAPSITDIMLSVESDTMYINGEPVNIEKPYITSNGVLMVPIRAIAECFGAGVNWEDGIVSVIYQKDDEITELDYEIGSCHLTKGYVTGYDMTESAVLSEHGVTMVPLESVTDFFGADMTVDDTGNIRLSRKLYHTEDTEYFTSSRCGWSIRMPEDRIIVLSYKDGYEEVGFGRQNLMSIRSYYKVDDSSIDDLYENLKSMKLGEYETGAVAKETDENGDEYIFQEIRSLEGVVLEKIYCKNDIYYWFTAVIYDRDKVSYYKELMDTFVLQVRTGDNVIDLSEVNNETNLYYVTDNGDTG